MSHLPLLLTNFKKLIRNFKSVHSWFYRACIQHYHFYLHPAAIDESKRPKSFRGDRQSSSGLEEDEDDSMLCKTVITRDRRYITQITCYEKGSGGGSAASEAAIKIGGRHKGSNEASRLPTYGKQTNGGALASLFNFPSRRQQNSGNGGGGLSMPRNRQQQQLLLTGT